MLLEMEMCESLLYTQCIKKRIILETNIIYKCIGNISKIRVFDLIGKQMDINILEENKLDVTSLKDGIYFLMLENRFVGRFEMKR